MQPLLALWPPAAVETAHPRIPDSRLVSSAQLQLPVAVLVRHSRITLVVAHAVHRVLDTPQQVACRTTSCARSCPGCSAMTSLLGPHDGGCTASAVTWHRRCIWRSNPACAGTLAPCCCAGRAAGQQLRVTSASRSGLVLAGLQLMHQRCQTDSHCWNMSNATMLAREQAHPTPAWTTCATANCKPTGQRCRCKARMRR